MHFCVLICTVGFHFPLIPKKHEETCTSGFSFFVFVVCLVIVCVFLCSGSFRRAR